MTDCPLVMVEWEDSAQPVPGWQHLSEFTPQSVIKCVSVGWLIHDSTDMLVIAPNMGDLDSENNVQVSGVIRIPARCVVSVKELEEPELTSCPFSRPDQEPKLPKS
jgi:hypothetical protein